MNRQYCCPKCNATLNPDQCIILVGHLEGQKILIGFHPEPGNYKIYVPPGIEMVDGLAWDLMCPVCHENLATDDIDNLCALDFHEDGEQLRLMFSRVRGEKVTFVTSFRKITRRYGEHAADYTPMLLNKEFFL